MKTALFLIGGWDGHQPQQCSDLVINRLKDLRLESRQVHALDQITDGTLEGVDVIVPCWTMGELSHERTVALERRIRAGCGLAGWHGGMGDAFRANTEYQFMVGGQFVAHPGNIIDYVVELTGAGHTITQGMPSRFNVRSEQYYMHTDPGNSVLATTTFSGDHAPWTRGVRMPVIWTRHHGTGRVAYCSIGHATDDLGAEPVLDLVARGIAWAAGALE